MWEGDHSGHWNAVEEEEVVLYPPSGDLMKVVDVVSSLIDLISGAIPSWPHGVDTTVYRGTEAATHRTAQTTTSFNMFPQFNSLVGLMAGE